MQVFVSGTWKFEKALPFSGQARHLGRALARAGFDLACGPGTGIARHVIDGYRDEPQRGTVRYYLPQADEMEQVGEPVEPGADEIEHTDLDYPMRNVLQVKRSHGLFVLTGGDGTLEEILPAVIDYRIPVAAVRDAGSAARALEPLLEIYPEWRALIELGPDVDSLIEPFVERVRAVASRRQGPRPAV
jgi:predicted Rossmann-fold nucleotide-binding protein